MKRGGRNNKSSQHGTAITLKVMESKTTRDLLENSDPLIVSLDRGQPDMVVVEDSIVEEELRSTDLTSAHDVPKQVWQLYFVLRFSE